MRVLTLLSALGCGLMGGVFFAFSAFVMKGLKALPAPQGVAAMQSINVAAVAPPLMTALFGTAFACVALIVLTARNLHAPGAALRLFGALAYLFVVALTIAYHVPRNDALANLTPDSAEAARFWTTYLSGWTSWNHVRTAGSMLASLLLVQASRIV